MSDVFKEYFEKSQKQGESLVKSFYIALTKLCFLLYRETGFKNINISLGFEYKEFIDELVMYLGSVIKVPLISRKYERYEIETPVCVIHIQLTK